MMKEFLNQVETGPNHTMKAPNMNMLCNLYDVKSDRSFSKMLFRCNTSGCFRQSSPDILL